GALVRRVPGLDYSVCPLRQPCDPLPVLPHEVLGTALVVLGLSVVVVVSTALAFYKRTGVSRLPGDSESPDAPTFYRRILSPLLYLLAAGVVALGVTVMILAWRSPITCEPGSSR